MTSEAVTLAAATVEDRPAHQARGLTRTMRWLLGGYVALIVTIMLVAQISMTPDLFVLWTLVIAVMLGRGGAFLRDWVPLVAIFVGWESARGLSQHLASRVASDSIIAIERSVSFGIVPTEELQRAFYDPARVTLLSLSMSAVYLSHFLLPLAAGFLFWLRSRPLFIGYMTALLVVSFAAFFTAIVLPVAPPRFSAEYGEALAVRDVMADTFRHLGSTPSSWLYGNINGNPVAAFPSLHAAYPFIAYLFIRGRWPRLGWLVLAYCAVVWFAITYLGHHYVIDIYAGVAYAIAGVWIVRTGMIHGWFSRLGRSAVAGRVVLRPFARLGYSLRGVASRLRG